jgi:hypothetical protein
MARVGEIQLAGRVERDGGGTTEMAGSPDEDRIL